MILQQELFTKYTQSSSLFNLSLRYLLPTPTKREQLSKIWKQITSALTSATCNDEAHEDNGKGMQMIRRRRTTKTSPSAEFNHSSSPQKMILRKVVPKTQTTTHHVDSAINNTTIGIRRNLERGTMKSTMAQDAVKDSFAESTLTKI
jgi:hypothetical protein